MRPVLSIVLVLALLSHARVGLAQSGDSDTRRAAYRQGYAAAQAKQWDEAYAIFLRLWHDAPSYDVALHLGHAEFNLGKNREAAEHLAFGIAHLPPGEAKELADSSRRALARVKEEIGTVTLIVDRSGAAVRVDGEPRGATPIDFEIFLDPGAHSIEASLDGYGPATQTFKIARGEHRNVVLQLEPMVPAAMPSTSTTSPAPGPSTEQHGASNARTIALLSGIGVTAVAGVSTIVFALKGSSAANRADDARTAASGYGPNACGTPLTAPANICASLQKAENDRVAANRGANVSLAITGVAALATATMFIVWPRKAPTRTAMTTITVTPTAGRNAAALLVNGTFN